MICPKNVLWAPQKNVSSADVGWNCAPAFKVCRHIFQGDPEMRISVCCFWVEFWGDSWLGAVCYGALKPVNANPAGYQSQQFKRCVLWAAATDIGSPA